MTRRIVCFVVFGINLFSTAIVAQEVKGERKALVLLADYSDRPARSCTVNSLQRDFFDRTPGAQTISNLLNTSSFGKASLSGQVVRVSLGRDPRRCDGDTLNQIMNSAKAASGLPVSSFTDFVFVNLPEGCGNNWGQGGNSWVFDDCQNFWHLGSKLHEFGHSLGFAHSGHVRPQGDNDERFREYFSWMGSDVYTLLPLSAPQMDAAGWFDASEVALIETAGTHSIQIKGTERADSSIASRIVKIPKPGFGHYYAVFHTRHGFGKNFDDFANEPHPDLNMMPKNYALKHVSIYEFKGGYEEPHLLALLAPQGTMIRDPSRGVKHVFEDPANGISISVPSLTLDHSAVVNVTLTQDLTQPTAPSPRPPGPGGFGPRPLPPRPAPKVPKNRGTATASIISPTTNSEFGVREIEVKISASSNAQTIKVFGGGSLKATIHGGGDHLVKIAFKGYGRRSIFLQVYDENGRFIRTPRVSIRLIKQR